MSRALPDNPGSASARSRRRGVSLVESIIGAAVLAMAVVAVFSAISAGTAHAEESARRIAATMAAEELLARVLVQRGSLLDGWDGYQESHGNLVDQAGRPLPQAQQRVSRSVEVTTELQHLPGFEPIEGRRVRVDTFGAKDQPLVSISEWVADEEPSP